MWLMIVTMRVMMMTVDADHDGNSEDDSVESVIVMIVTNSVMVILTVLEVMRTLMDLAGALVL